MAGSAKVPLTWGLGGPIIGTAHIDENGLIMAEIDAGVEGPWSISDVESISIFSVPEATTDVIDINTPWEDSKQFDDSLKYVNPFPDGEITVEVDRGTTDV